MIKLTKTAVDKLVAGTRDSYYFDTDLKGFGIKVTPSGRKSFIVQARVDGKKIRVTLGTYPAITCDQARDLALKELGAMVQGVNPNIEKKLKRVEGLTIAELYNEYKKAKALKPTTIRDYDFVLDRSGWLDKAWTTISPEQALKKHQALTTTIGKAKANTAMRVLRAIINHGMNCYQDNDGNPLIIRKPIQVLSATHSWHKLQARTDYIKPTDLAVWWEATTQLKPTTRDYIQFVLMTGLRRTEAETVLWSDVDFKQKTFTVRDTKNHLDHCLPLTDYLLAMLQARYITKLNEYVFGSAESKTGHFTEPKTAYKRISTLTGIEVSTHGLRRTFATIAESLDVPGYALKRLMNHKQAGDVTNSYIQMTPERLRVPMQQITDFILKAAHVKESAEIIPLTKNTG